MLSGCSPNRVFQLSWQRFWPASPTRRQVRSNMEKNKPGSCHIICCRGHGPNLTGLIGPCCNDQVSMHTRPRLPWKTVSGIYPGRQNRRWSSSLLALPFQLHWTGWSGLGVWTSGFSQTGLFQTMSRSATHHLTRQLTQVFLPRQIWPVGPTGRNHYTLSWNARFWWL
jgi:hypothetical protein